MINDTLTCKMQTHTKTLIRIDEFSIYDNEWMVLTKSFKTFFKMNYLKTQLKKFDSVPPGKNHN